MPETYDGDEGLRRFRRDLAAWFDAHEGALALRAPRASLDDEVARTRANMRVMWDAGWLRYGWPEIVEGYGGSPLLRTAVGEELSARGYLYDVVFAVIEVLVPTTIRMSPHLAPFATSFISGRDAWCQGFSEPDAGSDLASLRCKAVDAGDHFVVTGQKIWTSYAQFANRILVLVRTGTPESRHRGITALLVDMDTPGLTYAPLGAINDDDEFAETFFDGVKVPKDRVIGEVNGGWSIAMDILRHERGGIFWMLSVWMLNQLRHFVDHADLRPEDDQALGHAFASVAGLRARTWSTQHRMAADSITTPETSMDKILMATSEQELFDLIQVCGGGELEFGDDATADLLRAEYMYSRAASIYGGTGEIQRNIVADQVLGLRGAS